ncbi:MAG: ABC transporter permease, partial [Pseudobdellovibrionaceae bacterium]
LLVVVILGFVNTLLMSVMERTREIGILMAVGVSPWQIRWMIVLESVLVGVFSSVAAIVLGLAAVLYHQKMGFDLSPFVGENFEANQFSLSLIIYPTISIWPFVKVLGFTILIVIASALFPAYRASKLTPLDAIRS